MSTISHASRPPPAPVFEVRTGRDGLADFSGSRAMDARADTVLALATLGRSEAGPVTLVIETGTRAQIFVNDRLVRRILGTARQTLTVELTAGRNTVILALSGTPQSRTAGLRVVEEALAESW